MIWVYVALKTVFGVSLSLANDGGEYVTPFSALCFSKTKYDGKR